LRNGTIERPGHCSHKIFCTEIVNVIGFRALASSTKVNGTTSCTSDFETKRIIHGRITFKEEGVPLWLLIEINDRGRDISLLTNPASNIMNGGCIKFPLDGRLAIWGYTIKATSNEEQILTFRSDLNHLVPDKTTGRP